MARWTTGPTGQPTWWRYYEPPRWFPKWLHLATCTHCRGILRYYRQAVNEMKGSQ